MALVRRVLSLAFSVLAAQTAVASAGTYDVYSCTLPGGRPAPTEGWSPDRSFGNGIATDSCAAPPTHAQVGSLTGQLVEPTSSQARAAWIFTAPRHTTVNNFTFFRTARTTGSSALWYHDFAISYGLRGPVDSDHYAEYCTPHVACWGYGVGDRRPFDPSNRASASGLEVPQLVPQIVCDVMNGERCDPSSEHGWFQIHSARIGLSDPYAPQLVGQPSGALLANDAPVEGQRSISFAATDRGGGIEHVGVVVDGVIRMQRAAIDPALSRCRRPFTALVPCAPEVDTTLVFDTAQLPNGTHTIQASVIDAAGNETRSDPVTVTTRNGSRPNGRGASRFVRLSAWLRSRRGARRTATSVPYGAIRFAEGRLTDSAGAPIAGAVLDVGSRVQRPGAPYRPAATVTTSENGRFAYRIARGPSRTYRFEYRAYTLDPAPVSSAAVSLGVRAGIRLRLKPRRVRNGQRVRFRGRLQGGPARKGTRVTIDVLVPDARRRVPIGNVRADAKGRFRFAYRFRRTLVKARYRFQARLTAQPGYPYRGATSRPTSVLVVP